MAEIHVHQQNDQLILVEVKEGSKLLALASFFPDHSVVVPGRVVWGGRIDVKPKPKFLRQGIATQALRAGDKFIRDAHPDDLRVFRDKNGFSYKGYTDQITDAQLVDVDNDGFIFKP